MPPLAERPSTHGATRIAPHREGESPRWPCGNRTIGSPARPSRIARPVLRASLVLL